MTAMRNDVRVTSRANLLTALVTGTLHMIGSADILHVRSIEREDGSGKSFNVYCRAGSCYVRTVD